MGGLIGGDLICNTRATDAGLPGTYVAWLSTDAVDAKDRLGNARGWVRPDGLPFADTQADIVAGKIFYPLRIDELGHETPARPDEDEVFTGTGPDGTSTGGHCSNWTSVISSGNYTAGSTMSTGYHWTRSTSNVCSNGFQSRGRLYCFGIDRGTPLAFEPPAGRKAFLLKSFKPTGGLSAADSACQMAATAVGLPGQFAALLPTSSASAASRFSKTGPTWVRVDGVKLAPTAADFLNGLWSAGLNVTQDGEHVTLAYVWTGAASPAAIGDPTCSDWTGAGEGLAGDIGYYDQRGFGGFRLFCNNSAALYCLER